MSWWTQTRVDARQLKGLWFARLPAAYFGATLLPLFYLTAASFSLLSWLMVVPFSTAWWWATRAW